MKAAGDVDVIKGDRVFGKDACNCDAGAYEKTWRELCIQY